MAGPDDLSALMRLARQGDDEAYRRLLGHVAIWLRAVVRRGLASAGRGPAESEDIVQEALLAVHLKRETWDASRPIGPWLRAIAQHKLADHLRRRGFHDHLDIDEWSNAAELAVEVEADSGPADVGDLPAYKADLLTSTVHIGRDQEETPVVGEDELVNVAAGAGHKLGLGLALG